MVQRLYGVKRWMYRTGRPGAVARVANRISAAQFSAGILSPARAMTLEVPGRRTGRLVSFPVVVAEYQGGRYLVSMLGKDANWVRNVRAAGGRAVLRRGGREQVRLEEVEPGDRAPILRRYLAVAPGARPHLPVDRRAPLGEFERIAGQYPVFRIIPATPGAEKATARPPSRRAGRWSSART
jgi:deazaflavin-dependent oxidoreductase (nitroreductase family)